MKNLAQNLEFGIMAVLEQPDALNVLTHYSGSLDAHRTFDIRLEVESYSDAFTHYGGSGFYAYIHKKEEVPTPVVGVPGVAAHVCERPLSAYMAYRDYNGRRQFHVGHNDRDLARDTASSDRVTNSLLTVMKRGLQGVKSGERRMIDAGQASWDESLVDDFLGATLLAGERGAVRRIKTMQRKMGEVSVSARHMDMSGDVRHLRQSDIEEPVLSFSVVSDGIEHLYERLLTGRAEIKTRIADERIRYANLSSFAILCDEDGDPVMVSVNKKEVEALEAEDRAHGLYELTTENVSFLEPYVAMLS